MANFKILLNRVSPLYLICGYFLLFIALTLFKIQPYNFNISSLVGIWKGFVELNPTLIDKGFIIFNDGGYDGQFFYIISKSIFTNGLESFPILDSFYLRFNRLGLSLLSGFISIFVGFSFYPMITLLLLLFVHIFSFFILYEMLKKSNKYLSYFYLFSPFSLNSMLLLVSDSLFVSFTIISIYYLKQIGTGFSNSPIAKDKKIFTHVLIFLILCFTTLIKEFALILLITFLLISIIEKNHKSYILIFFSICFYLLVTQLLKTIEGIFPGTNPLGFLDLIDYPFIGFYKSIQINSFISIKNTFRELAKFPVFLFYFLLILNLLNIRNFRDIILFLPILFIIFTAGIGEVGYWLSFDNISRMFTLSIPWIVLLKNHNRKYNSYYALELGLLLLILLIIRLVYIKSPMSYYIN